MAKKTTEVKLVDKPTASQLFDELISKSYSDILKLNNKQETKSLYRTAIGHGYSEFGPIEVSLYKLNDFVETFFNYALLGLHEENRKFLNKKNSSIDAKHDKVDKAKTPREKNKAQEELIEATTEIKNVNDKIITFENGNKSALWEDIIDLARCYERAVHTHDGKLVHASSTTRLFQTSKPTQNVIPYLFGLTSSNERQVSAGFAHKPGFSDASVLFYAQFRYNNEVTSIGQLLKEGNPDVKNALHLAGLPNEVIELIQTIFKLNENSPNVVDSKLLQQLWPDEKLDDSSVQTYSALQTIPAISTYAALVHEKRRHRDNQYLPVNQLQVGSGQAQNISIFASGTSGYLTLLKCEPPRIIKTKNSWLLRACWRKSLIAPNMENSKKNDVDFEKSIWLRPNDQREKFLKAYASQHVAHAMRAINSARDLFDDQDEEWVNSVSQLNDAEKAYVCGDLLTHQQMTELFEKVLRRIPLESLSKHVIEDSKSYILLVKNAIKEECKG